MSLTGEARLKLPAISGVRRTNPNFGANDAPPFWHALGDTAGAIDAAQSLTGTVAYTLNLTGRCTDPNGLAVTFSAVSGSWPAGITPSYGTGTVGGTPASAGSGAITLRCGDGTNNTDQVFTWIVESPDITAPSTPGTPTLIERTATTATISWTASADASGIDFYSIMRAQGSCAQGFTKTLLATVEGDITQYTHINLAAGDLKCYQIKATDNFGNVSTLSGELSLPAYTAPATLVDDGFESYGTGAFVNNTTFTVSKNGTGAPTVSTTQANAGTKSIRNQVLRGSINDYRSELRIKSPLDSVPLQGTEQWFGFSTYLDTWSVPSSSAAVLFQVHVAEPPAPADANDTITNPWFTLYVQDGLLKSSARWAACQPTTNDCKSTQTYSYGPATSNVWVDWVIYAKWDWTSAGRLKVWKDGVLVIDRSGPIGYNDVQNGYAKIGLYIPTYDGNTNGPARTAYHDQIRTAGASGSYETVAPVP